MNFNTIFDGIYSDYMSEAEVFLWMTERLAIITCPTSSLSLAVGDAMRFYKTGLNCGTLVLTGANWARPILGKI